jgi:hypothetical protein
MSYAMLLWCISYSLFLQDTLCLVAPYLFRLEPLEDFDPLVALNMTGGDDVWLAQPQLFFSCSLCPTGQWQDTSSHRMVIRRFHWYSSAHLSLYLSPQTAACRGRVSLWFTNEQPPSGRTQPPTLYVCPVKNVLGRVPLLPSTSTEIFRIPFHTVFDNMFLLALLLIPGKTAGRAAGFSRSTSRCGATGGHFQERFWSRMQRRCAGNAFENQGAGELKL